MVREDQTTLSFDLWGTNVSVQAIDRRYQIWFASPVGKNKWASAGFQSLMEHGSRPICERNTTRVLALSLPDPQKVEPSTIYRRQGNVRRFQIQSLSDSRAGFQHHDGHFL